MFKPIHVATQLSGNWAHISWRAGGTNMIKGIKVMMISKVLESNGSIHFSASA